MKGRSLHRAMPCQVQIKSAQNQTKTVNQSTLRMSNKSLFLVNVFNSDSFCCEKERCVVFVSLSEPRANSPMLFDLQRIEFCLHVQDVMYFLFSDSWTSLQAFTELFFKSWGTSCTQNTHTPTNTHQLPASTPTYEWEWHKPLWLFKAHSMMTPHNLHRSCPVAQMWERKQDMNVSFQLYLSIPPLLLWLWRGWRAGGTGPTQMDF